MSGLGTTPWQEYLTQHHDHFVKEMVEFCRIPSISSLHENADDVKKAAEWVAKRMKDAGIEHVNVMPTGGHPVVYGDWLHATGRPTILMYGHFDTQPVDPLNLWTHPPFEPVIHNNRLYARGVSDDKGNMLIPILAVEAFLKSESRLPVNVKFMFEGQEEIGSPQLPHFVAAQKKLLACDLVLSADGGQWSEEQGNIMIGLKGICGIQIDMKGATTDLHSGVYGGTIQNPLHAMAALIASMRSADGKILVDGFYDDVVALSKEDRQHIAVVPYDEGDYKKDLGVDDVFGEPGYTTRERAWARPTLEVNGMWGGFQGEGTKTVLPNEAHAKITCRLVAKQNPTEIMKRLADHVHKHAPKGVKTTVTASAATSMPYLMAADHPGNQAAAAVLTELYGKPPYYTRLGGSIPVCPLFLKEIGAYTVIFAFGMEDEKVHAPDEFLRLSSFERGQKGYCMLLQKLAHTQGLTHETP
jgi:acetylornithine deacetylase/succinyl-diaminopimelate desuccinylase-like protein